jgi:dipeptidyl aminopeptidase/acylaminoacyl peptidase
LLQKGYVVLAPDYRGSIGYGRDWRQGVYKDVGGKDADDAAAGAAYLKTLGYVDPERIGVWGLSYGGFFTLEAMTRTPTLFRCGVDVAGTVDYLMYLNAWTFGRMGTPEESPAAYEVAGPVKRVDRIVRPLLVLHGTSDVNVAFLHSVRLIDELLKNGKDVEFMVYPGEFHYFTRAHVLRDAWQRVDRFFDKHLRTP